MANKFKNYLHNFKDRYTITNYYNLNNILRRTSYTRKFHKNINLPFKLLDWRQANYDIISLNDTDDRRLCTPWDKNTNADPESSTDYRTV